MYEHLVTNVQEIPPKKEGYHRLHFDLVEGGYRVGYDEVAFALAHIGAIEVWLKQPKTLTPEERAEAVFQRIQSSPRQHIVATADEQAEYKRWIAAEIRAAVEVATNG